MSLSEQSRRIGILGVFCEAKPQKKVNIAKKRHGLNGSLPRLFHDSHHDFAHETFKNVQQMHIIKLKNVQQLHIMQS